MSIPRGIHICSVYVALQWAPYGFNVEGQLEILRVTSCRMNVGLLKGDFMGRQREVADGQRSTLDWTKGNCRLLKANLQFGQKANAGRQKATMLNERM